MMWLVVNQSNNKPSNSRAFETSASHALQLHRFVSGGEVIIIVGGSQIYILISS